MDLNSKQLSSLNEMGITVWEFRTQDTDSVVEEPLSPEIIERLNYCQWLIVLELQFYQEAEQRLLNAILFSIGLSFDHVVILSPKQFSTLEKSKYLSKPKIVFILGEAIPSEKNTNSQLSVFTSFSLTKLLNKPKYKAQAWKTLKLAKKTAQQ